MSNMADVFVVRVIPLICPTCGKSVPAGDNDVIYYCAGCDAAWEIEGEGLVRRELRHLDGEGDVRLPFWVIPFRIATREGAVDTVDGYIRLSGGGSGAITMVADGPEAVNANHELLTAIYRENRGIRNDSPRLFVPACPFHNTPQYIQAGRLLTVRQPEFKPAVRVPERLYPIIFREEDSRKMGDTILLAAVAKERQRGPAFIDSFTCTLNKGTLCTIPFMTRGTRFYHVGLNLEF